MNQTQSFIIHASNQSKAGTYIADFCKKENISHFDTQTIASDTSVGIEDVRSIQKKLYISAALGKAKAFVIKKAESATHQAQNALLKMLEEPPKNTYLFLLTENPQQLLATIRSRCTLVTLDTPNTLQAIDTKESINLSNASIGLALTLSQNHAKSKDEALAYTKMLIETTRQQLIDAVGQGKDKEKEIEQHKKAIESLQKAYFMLKTTSVSPRLILEYTLLQ